MQSIYELIYSLEDLYQNRAVKNCFPHINPNFGQKHKLISNDGRIRFHEDDEDLLLFKLFYMLHTFGKFRQEIIQSLILPFQIQRL